ncbi:MAG TPA: M48 family metallopeptidase [Patescibacteria group bacterium]|nr:M48 family metallopeptidase [Patescibacteria group bacterium]
MNGSLQEKISAYPGSLTYLDLIRRNRRDSAMIMIVMILLGMCVGGAIAASLAFYSGLDPGELLGSVMLGALAALLAGSLATAWSWFGGASAILSMSGARPIEKSQDPELFNVVEEIAIAAGLPMPRVYLIDDSAMNAFATGRDPEHAAVAITTGLRQRLTRDELQGVLAHEVAHVRHFDIRFGMLMATMVGLIVFACDAFWRIAFRTGRIGRRSGGKNGGAAVLVVIVIALVLAIIAPLFARLLQLAYSRRREYLADAGGVELTRNPEGLASALGKLAGDTDPLVDTANRGTAHLFIVNPLERMRASGQSLNTMFSSHPPIQDRIARLLALVR